jgi:hypothetical protein
MAVTNEMREALIERLRRVAGQIEGAQTAIEERNWNHAEAQCSNARHLLSFLIDYLNIAKEEERYEPHWPFK